ncbi:hypothetical protein Tco_0121963 [Tanacetum coccineum]
MVHRTTGGSTETKGFMEPHSEVDYYTSTYTTCGIPEALNLIRESNMSRANPQATIVSKEQLVLCANRLKITKNNQCVASDSFITDTLLKLSIPQRSDAEMHNEGQNSPLTKLINTVNGYKYYKHKKDESEKGKAAEEPEEQHVCLVRSGRGKGYMCLGNQEVNLPRKPKKAVVPKKLRTLTIVDNIVEETIVVELAKSVSIKEQRLQQRVATEDPSIQSLLDLRRGSKEIRLKSIRQKRQSVGGERSSAAHYKYYEFEDISTTDSDATRDSSCSYTDEEKDDETDDSEDLDMDLSDDEPNNRDDDAIGFGVFMYNKSTEPPKSTSFSPIITCSSLEYIQNIFNEPLVQELTDLICKPVYTYAHTTFEVANLEGNPELTSLMRLMTPIRSFITPLYEAITLDQEALDAQDIESSFNKRTHNDEDPPNDCEGETRKKRRKDAGEPSSRSSKKDKSPVKLKAFIKKYELTIANLKGAGLEKLKKRYKNDVELEYHVDQLKASVLTEAQWSNDKGDVSKPISFEKYMSKSTKPHSCFYNNDFYYLVNLSTGEKYATSLTKHFAARYHIQGIKDMIPDTWSKKIHHYQIEALNGIHHWKDARKDFFKQNIKSLMKLSEVNKLCDGTLLKIRDNLLEMVNKNELGRGNKRLKGRDWSNKYIKRSNEMLEKINKTLKHKEQLRRLEEYVGGHPKTFEPRLFVRP